jgi:hypothetical protein
MFPVYGEKCLSCNAVPLCGKYFIDDEEVETEASKWLREQSKYFYSAGFDSLVKRWGMCINIGGEYVEKYFFPEFRILHVPRFIAICNIFTEFPWCTDIKMALFSYCWLH